MLMKRLVVPTCSMVFLLGLAGCGRTQKPLVASSFSNGHIVRATSGNAVWILSGSQLRPVTTGQVQSPRSLPAQIASVAFADQQNGWLGALVSGSIRIYRTSNGGSGWAQAGSTSILGNEPVASVNVAAIGQRIVVLAIDQTSSNFSSAAAVVSTDGGATWSTARAPVAGTISTAGNSYWLVGGVQNNQVYTSTTGLAWTPITLSATGTTWSAGNPVGISGGRVVLPLTIRDSGGSTTVSIRVSSDSGATWTEAASVTPSETTAVGVAAPVSIAEDGTWQTFATDGSKIYEGSVDQPSAQPKILSPNGIAGSPIEVLFLSGTQGVLLAASTVCPSGKASCSTGEELFGTTDSGQTWSAQSGQ